MYALGAGIDFHRDGLLFKIDCRPKSIVWPGSR